MLNLEISTSKETEEAEEKNNTALKNWLRSSVVWWTVGKCKRPKTKGFILKEQGGNGKRSFKETSKANMGQTKHRQDKILMLNLQKRVQTNLRISWHNYIKNN